MLPRAKVEENVKFAQFFAHSGGASHDYSSGPESKLAQHLEGGHSLSVFYEGDEREAAIILCQLQDRIENTQFDASYLLDASQPGFRNDQGLSHSPTTEPLPRDFGTTDTRLRSALLFVQRLRVN